MQRTQKNAGMFPTIITVYSDRSFTFITKTPPATYLLKKNLRKSLLLISQVMKVAGTVSKNC